MAGMGRPDEEAECAYETTQSAIAIYRAMVRKGPSRKHCLDCGEDIPEARREAVSGCLYCIECQEDHDWEIPSVNMVTKML